MHSFRNWIRGGHILHHYSGVLWYEDWNGLRGDKAPGAHTSVAIGQVGFSTRRGEKQGEWLQTQVPGQDRQA